MIVRFVKWRMQAIPHKSLLMRYYNPFEDENERNPGILVGLSDHLSRPIVMIMSIVTKTQNQKKHKAKELI